MFPRVPQVPVQHGKSGDTALTEVDQFRARSIRQRVVCAIAIDESLLERGDQVVLFRQGVLDLCVRRLPGFTLGWSAQVVLVVSHMRYLLAKTAHIG